MHKPAPTDAPLIDAVGDRWSPRAFSDRTVSVDDITTLLEAARWAPSCMNAQPWRFLWARKGEEGYGPLHALLDDFNRGWAPGAPVLLLTLARKRFDNGKDNAHAWHDVGLAMGGLLAQATSMGIAAHQMAGFDWKGANEALGIPDAFAPVAMVAIGYPGDPDQLSEKLAKQERAERSRKPLSDMAFRGGWPAS